jgi:nitrite reductase/ring-hydroxylating ferredoxin subunit
MAANIASSGVRVCGFEELADGHVVCRRLPGGLPVAVARLADGTVVAFENVCPHKAGPIGEGRVRDGVIACPWHGFRFDLRTGKAAGFDSIMRLRLFQTAVRDGDVFVAA